MTATTQAWDLTFCALCRAGLWRTGRQLGPSPRCEHCGLRLCATHRRDHLRGLREGRP